MDKLPNLQQDIVDALTGKTYGGKLEPSSMLLRLDKASFSLVSTKSGVRIRDVNWHSVRALERKGIVKSGERIDSGRWKGATRYELTEDGKNA